MSELHITTKHTGSIESLKDELDAMRRNNYRLMQERDDAKEMADAANRRVTVLTDMIAEISNNGIEEAHIAEIKELKRNIRNLTRDLERSRGDVQYLREMSVATRYGHGDGMLGGSAMI